MLSRSGLYALQAALRLARMPEGTSASAARLAEDLELPPEYLAKILRRMSRTGLLASTRGARGGYRLVVSPDALTVEEVVQPFEEVRPAKVCLLGGPCHSERPCPAHVRRLEWNEARRRILANTVLTDLLPDPDTLDDGPLSVLTNIDSQ